MKKGARVLLWAILALISLVLVFFSLTNGMEKIKTTPATLYVNGNRLETHAIIYWYDRSALAQFPLFSTLKSLGCQIERDESGNSSNTVISAGNRRFVLERGKYSSDLYENGKLVYSDVARPEKGSNGLLYLDERECEKVLTIMGFDQISWEIIEEQKIVMLTASQQSVSR